MPVYKLKEEMPFEEMQKWEAYFKLRPIGWREDDRTMKLLQAQGVKAAPETIFSSLASLRGAPTEKTIGDSLKGSGVFHFLKNAKGGDKIE